MSYFYSFLIQKNDYTQFKDYISYKNTRFSCYYYNINCFIVDKNQVAFMFNMINQIRDLRLIQIYYFILFFVKVYEFFNSAMEKIRKKKNVQKVEKLWKSTIKNGWLFIHWSSDFGLWCLVWIVGPFRFARVGVSHSLFLSLLFCMYVCISFQLPMQSLKIGVMVWSTWCRSDSDMQRSYTTLVPSISSNPKLFNTILSTSPPAAPLLLFLTIGYFSFNICKCHLMDLEIDLHLQFVSWHIPYIYFQKINTVPFFLRKQNVYIFRGQLNWKH